MLTGQSILFNFLRAVLLGILSAILFFLLLGSNTYLANLGPTLALVIQGVAAMLVVFIVNFLDTYLNKVMDKEAFPKVGRVLYQLVISHFITAAIFLPFMAVYANTNPEANSFWLFTLGYAVINILMTRNWQQLYSQNPTKNINTYGPHLTLAVLTIVVVINGSFLDTATPIVTAAIVTFWFLVEFIIETMLGLVYYGLNNFYDASFWHFTPPIKTKEEPEVNPAPQVDQEISSSEEE